MFIASEWKDYEVIDTGDGEKLERWKNIILRRPDPQAIWPKQNPGLWTQADAWYHRSAKGGGEWEFFKKLPERWTVRYGDLKFYVRPTGFKHTGLFPEQAVNWDWMRSLLKPRPNAKVLNLFAYTGGATCACAKEQAQVVHVDAAKGMLAWAKDNLAACGLTGAPVRFIADDAMKFVLREQRRGNRYDGILMDPPSYGRGPDGEMWKIEQDIYPLVEAAAALLSDKPLFFLINSYTTGLAPTVIKNVLDVALKGKDAQVEAAELCLPVRRDNLLFPCGATGRAWWK